MQKFHIFGISFTVYFLALIIWDQGHEVSFLLYSIPGLIIAAVIGWASMNIDSQFFVDAYCHGTETKKQVAFTFDDGPDPQTTPKVLDLLKKYELPATFFVIGSKINGQEALLKRIDEEGHTIGNHSFNHSVQIDFRWIGYIRKEIQKTKEQIQAVIGKSVRFFRPPFGVTNPHISIAVGREKVKVIGWNIRSFDTALKEKEQIIKRVKKGLKPGGIFLFHDTQPILVEVLKELVPFLQKEGYEVVSLDQLIGEKAYFE